MTVRNSANGALVRLRGAYSMIYGQHPADATIFWHIEGELVKVLAFADIKWPADVRLPWLEEPRAKAVQNRRMCRLGSFHQTLKNG